MDNQLLYFILAIFVALIPASMVLWLVAQQRAQQYPGFLLMAATLLFATLGEAFGYTMRRWEFGIELAAMLRMTGLLFLPLHWHWMIVQLTNKPGWLRPQRVAALYTIPIVGGLLLWTNAWHGWFWQSTELATLNEVTYLKTTPGVAFDVIWLANGILVVAGVIMILSYGMQRWQTHPQQVGGMVAALLIAGSGVLAHVVDLGMLPGYSPLLLAFSLAMGFFWWAVSEFDLLSFMMPPYQVIIDNLPDSVAVLDFRGRVLAMNQPMQARFSQAVVMGQPFHFLLPQIDQTLNRAPDITAMNEVLTLDHQVVQLRTRPLIRGKQRAGVVVMLHDLTERRRMQDQLREAQRQHYEDLNQLKDAFVQAVSHDLKSPVTVVMGFAEILEDSPHITHPQDLNALHQIGETALRMKQLILDLLDLSRIEGGVPLQMARHDINPYMAELAENLRMVAAEKFIQLDYVPSPHPIYVQFDRNRMAQVVHNLVSNAIKYTPPEGQITLSIHPTDSMTEIVVADTGLGIPENAIPHLFDRFYRVPEEAHRRQQGAGLGLSIVKAIVDQHHGSLRVESRLGRGTTIYVGLPNEAKP